MQNYNTDSTKPLPKANDEIVEALSPQYQEIETQFDAALQALRIVQEEYNLGSKSADEVVRANQAVLDLSKARSRIAYPEIPHFDVPTVLIAQDLSPADTADLETDKILAIVTAGGGPTSHTAIIARSNGIAAIVACPGVVEAASANAGASVAVDATTGQITFNPNDA
ncbi:MAG: hypothetical protein EB109_03825, partial [Methylophilaceae bacterium]|nr:hypothetical protein [Methylophilaceae bacterium]